MEELGVVGWLARFHGGSTLTTSPSPPSSLSNEEADTCDIADIGLERLLPLSLAGIIVRLLLGPADVTMSRRKVVPRSIGCVCSSVLP